MIRTIIYARVSTTDQVSTKQQIEELETESRLKGEDIIDIFEEKRSAKDKKGVYNPEEYMMLRPYFYNIFLKAKRKEFDILRVWKWDRFSRSNLQPVLIDMFKDYGVTVTASRDSNEPLVVGIQGVISKEEINKIKARVELRQQGLKQEHHFMNRPPFGYYVEKEKLSNGRVICIGNKFSINEKESNIVKEIFELFLKKVPVPKIAKKFKLDYQKVNRILNNPTYCGYNTFRDEIYKGKHEPIISKDIFLKVNKEFKFPDDKR